MHALGKLKLKLPKDTLHRLLCLCLHLHIKIRNENFERDKYNYNIGLRRWIVQPGLRAAVSPPAKCSTEKERYVEYKIDLFLVFRQAERVKSIVDIVDNWLVSLTQEALLKKAVTSKPILGAKL